MYNRYATVQIQLLPHDTRQDKSKGQRSRSQHYTIQLEKRRESVTRNRIDFKLVMIFFVRDVGCDDGSRSLEHVPEMKIEMLSAALHNIIGPRRSTQSVGFKTVPLF